MTQAKYRAANPEKVAKARRLSTQKWKDKNREHVAAKVAAWAKNNPGKCREYAAKHRAKHGETRRNKFRRETMGIVGLPSIEAKIGDLC